MIEHKTTHLKSQELNGRVTHTITVNDRAATRATIFRRITAAGFAAIERSDWAALKIETHMESDWDYSMIAIHHIGQRESCNPGSLQMQDIQRLHIKTDWDDIGYHFGIDCSGFIFEGRDIRQKGSNVNKFNTGVIGIVLLENLLALEEGHEVLVKGKKSLKKYFNYDTTQEIPNKQIAALLTLIDVLRSVFNITILGGHMEYPHQQDSEEGRICPGEVGMVLVEELREHTNLLPPPFL
ncbi:N-acetylmuramoyl-L-alanine amidase [Pseudomonas sp. NA-150]|uniref:peptidoglycan recognition protein family protein n=1 Tax=Pseudomonas sp. NA-150 TaxID=3367525 RepID=UPI0037C6FA48